MLEDEIRLAMRKTGCTLPVVWLERGLHERPEKLREELLRHIGEHPVSHILLAFSLCGNALIGVGSPTSRLVAPCFPDCIHMGLALTAGQPAAADIHSLYVTRGWLTGERSVLAAFRRDCDTFGRETALQVYRDEIYKNYQSLCVLETGAYTPEEIQAAARETAETLGLVLRAVPGSVRVLEKLFAGDWDDEFRIAEPGGRFTPEQFLPGRGG
jgi:hypothetical protein